MKIEIAYTIRDPGLINILHKRITDIEWTNNGVSGLKIKQTINDVLPGTLQEQLIYSLIGAKALIVRIPASSLEEYSFSIDKELADKYFQEEQYASRILKEAEKFSFQDNSEKFKFVATIPKEISAEITIADIHPIFASLKSLISSTINDIWIVNPFFDIAGMKMISQSLVAAAKSGVKINILTREEYGKNNEQGIRSIGFLVKKLQDIELLNQLEIRTFQKKKADSGRHITAVHSKYIISDSCKAYIGSANITEHCLKNNFEIGVIIQGSPIRELAQITNIMWENAKIVEFKQID